MGAVFPLAGTSGGSARRYLPLGKSRLSHVERRHRRSRRSETVAGRFPSRGDTGTLQDLRRPALPMLLIPRALDMASPSIWPHTAAGAPVVISLWARANYLTSRGDTDDPVAARPLQVGSRRGATCEPSKTCASPPCHPQSIGSGRLPSGESPRERPEHPRRGRATETPDAYPLQGKTPPASSPLRTDPKQPRRTIAGQVSGADLPANALESPEHWTQDYQSPIP